MASVSPGFREWIYFETLPVSYFLMMKVNSPSRSDAEMGVYGRYMGFPLASLKSSALRYTHEATGSREAFPSPKSNTNLAFRHVGTCVMARQGETYLEVLWLYGSTRLSLMSTKFWGSSGLVKTLFGLTCAASPL